MSTTIQKLESILGTKSIPSDYEKELFAKTQDFIQYLQMDSRIANGGSF